MNHVSGGEINKMVLRVANVYTSQLSYYIFQGEIEHYYTIKGFVCVLKCVHAYVCECACCALYTGEYLNPWLIFRS